MGYVRYVVGFSFDKSREFVILIKKNRPEWQRGRLNGIGGKIEPGGETPEQAMVREWAEETNGESTVKDWEHIALLDEPGACVYFFRCFNHAVFEGVASGRVTDEDFQNYAVDSLIGRAYVLPNVKWLVPFCLHSGSDKNGQKLVLPLQMMEQ